MAAPLGTVLLVEDDASVRALISDVHSDEGYVVVEAGDGAEATRLLEQHQPPPNVLGLVLLDMMLPRVDGIDVLRHLADLDCYVPVVAMSASREFLEKAANEGASATLPKPFDLDGLLSVVERHCGQVPAAYATACERSPGFERLLACVRNYGPSPKDT